MSADNPSPGPARINPIRAGLRSRCPECGQGRLYSGFIRVVDQCADCGYDFRQLNTGDGAAVFVMQAAGFPVVFSALWLEIVHSPPIWVHLAIWPPMIVILALALMRPFKGVMVALQVRNRAGEASHGRP